LVIPEFGVGAGGLDAARPSAPVAVVTGASRGIGKAIAVHLARAGYDVAIMARSVAEGGTQEYSPTVTRSDRRVLPGSLETTAHLIVAAGRRALPIRVDLLNRASLEPAVNSVLDHFGRIDLLVNNARYVGPGHLDLFVETPIDLIEKQISANVMAPLTMIALALPGMLAAGTGTIINITSMAATQAPPAPAKAGGWGLGYAVSKGAFHRVAPVLAAELGARGIKAFNLDPGFVATERNVLAMKDFGVDSATGAPPDLVGEVVVQLLAEIKRESESGVAHLTNGGTIYAQPGTIDEL
jgi:NAD(P)-dependent dehydrogenase (short-subunit alcohol dehydrogenase family)